MQANLLSKQIITMLIFAFSSVLFGQHYVNGVIAANEYGNHNNGFNQQSSAGGTWYMSWDDSNLYIGIAGANIAEGAILYLDKNPITPVNGGTDADGNLTGFSYDGSDFPNLQFRADLVVYFKDNYREYRTANGAGSWPSSTSGFGSSVSKTEGNVRELSIPWSALGGKPASFNWFGYVAYAGGAYATVPTQNPGGTLGMDARFPRYYTVSDTAEGSETPPFSRNSYTFTGAADVSAFGPVNVYDFTMNTSGKYLSRSGNVGGDWNIAGNLTIGAGTIYMGSSGSGYGKTKIAGNLNLLGGTYDMDATTAATSVTGNVNIASGANLKLSSQAGGDFIAGNVVNNGGVVVNDGVSFIQTVGATYAGSGILEAKSSSTSAANKYTFWSSPIVDQNMYGIFGANTPPFVMTYNTATNYYDTLINPATSVQGKGYSIKTAVANPAVNFSGVPNNGPFNITLSMAADKYNLVGNPYPSNLDLAAFYTANSANIGSTIWFWDYTGGTVTNQTGSTASNFGYATYNALGGTWIDAPNGSATPDVNYTKVGQAFIVEAASTTLSFDNTLRVADAGVVINKSSNANEGKFWLTLQTSYNAKVTQAITYQNGASNNFDNYDSRAIGVGSDAFYSFADAEKVVIQGRSTFNSSDVVALGNKHFEAGNFKIELTQKEGLFADGQAIYLRDKTLGIETNLQEGAYLFSSTAGDFSDRFEVVYSKSVLGTSAAAKSTLSVYRNGDDFVIDSPSKITSVEVYDASGKLVKSSKSNGNKETVSNLSRGVFILKITTATETVSKKVIK